MTNLHTVIIYFQIEDSKDLGEWVGLCKLDAEGKARKVVGCSCVVVRGMWLSLTFFMTYICNSLNYFNHYILNFDSQIKSWGEESRARTTLLETLASME